MITHYEFYVAPADVLDQLRQKTDESMWNLVDELKKDQHPKEYLQADAVFGVHALYFWIAQGNGLGHIDKPPYFQWIGFATQSLHSFMINGSGRGVLEASKFLNLQGDNSKDEYYQINRLVFGSYQPKTKEETVESRIADLAAGTANIDVSGFSD